MNAQTTVVIAEAIARLSIARGAAVDERVADVYITALMDLDPDVVRRACGELAKQPRAEFDTVMPSVGAIREEAGRIASLDASRRAKALLMPAPKDEENEPRYFCLDCRDEPSGWRIFQCRGAGRHAATGDGPFRPCGRGQDHASHSFAEKCACLPYNPISAKSRERMAAARQRTDSKGGHK